VSNQRTFPRFPLTLDVSVSVAGGVQVCHVRDYCAGGIFLLYGKQHRNIPQGSDIGIQFTDPERPSEYYQLIGKVARAMEHGVGVSFIEPNQVALMVLATQAQKQAVSLQKPANEQLDKSQELIINQCRDVVGRAIHTMVADFVQTADEQLCLASEESISQTHQAAFFIAVNELKQSKKKLIALLDKEVLQRINVLNVVGYSSAVVLPGAEPGDELSLVDSESFDQWLIVSSIASRVEEHQQQALEALETRLASIAVNTISRDNNPVSPLAFASVFSRIIEEMRLEDDARKAIFLVLAGVVERDLTKLYEELNGLLISHGICPDLEKNRKVVKAPGAAAISSVAQKERTVEATPAKVGEKNSSTSVSKVQVRERPAEPRRIAPQHATFRISYSRLPTAEHEGEALVHKIPFQEVRELMQLQYAGEPRTPPPAGYFSSEELIHALSHLATKDMSAQRESMEELGHAQYLTQLLARLTGEKDKELNDTDRDSITYIGGLLNSMLQDRQLPKVVEGWLSRMTTSLLRAGVNDPGVLEDVDHPARQVVNRLEQVGRYIENDADEQRATYSHKIESILESIQERVGEDPHIFAEALESLDEIHNRYRNDYRIKIDRIVQQCEQESNLNRVRSKILDDLNELLGHRDVPKISLKLLDYGLKNLLFRTRVKEGAKSESYRKYLNFIDQLTARLAGHAPVMDGDSLNDDLLLEQLAHLLAASSANKAANQTLLDEVRSSLSGGRRPAMQYVPALTIKTSHLDEFHSKPETLDMDAWQLILDDARNIEHGEALAYEDEESGRREVSLIWHDEENKPPRYVFADDRGEKMLDLSLGEVASLLHQNILERMAVRELSVTERATYNFLQDIHNNLAFRAQHDELTGLLNRKSFVRKLEQIYNDAVASKRRGVLGYFDLDRFNVINTTCGHAEGDKLLEKVAEILRENMGENAMVARLGGDEFGVIMEGASRVEGLKRINVMHDAIRDIRFSCEENEFNVTASVGLAEINDSIDGSGRLLSAVDAACFTAKEQGRDNIQIHNPENVNVSSHTNILEWVGRINVLFEKNLIKLRCQRIEPLKKSVNALPHYEVLLDVYDGNGNKVPLEEFIVAAERYNRIVDIDTWVVDNVFSWLEQNRSKLDHISGLSINLSGSSLGNRKFMERLSRHLSEDGIPAEKVIFEVTETIAINNLDNAARFMRKMKEVGCRFSLDDFGSGNSSYAYLKTLPIDFLKIDGTFVKDVAKNTDDFAVVKSINEIGHVMGKTTIAEYVEDEFALQALKTIGLDYVQGFGIEKPIPLYKLLN